MNLKIEGKLTEENPVKTILSHRDLDESWLNAGEEFLLDGREMRNFKRGWELLEKHKKNKAVILIDNDTDGITSFAVMYQWLKRAYPDMEVSYVMGEGKVHGIIRNILPDSSNYQLLIIPDASSSEVDKHKALAEEGIEILVLDHHEISEVENPYAVIINPHHPDCPYLNKNLSGVGVVYKFIEGIDKELETDRHTDFLDLVATGLVGDVMPMTSLENKALINLGIKNIKNPYIQAYLKADGRIKGKDFTPTIIGFYLAPQINALIRMGKIEDKLELCQALIGDIDSEIVVAKIISIKGKQDRSKDPIITRIIMDLQKNKKDMNKVIFAEVPKRTPKALTGLIAGQLASLYQKPVLLGHYNEEKQTFSGSARSLNNSSVEDLKDFCEASENFNFVAGHQAAFGWEMPVDKVNSFIDYTESKLPKVEKYYSVWEVEGNMQAVLAELSKLDAHYGPGFEPILIYTKVYGTEKNVDIIGAKQNTLRIQTPEVNYIKFRYKDGLPHLPSVFNIVGEPNKNDFNNTVSYQLFIKDIEAEKIQL